MTRRRRDRPQRRRRRRASRIGRRRRGRAGRRGRRATSRASARARATTTSAAAAGASSHRATSAAVAAVAAAAVATAIATAADGVFSRLGDRPAVRPAAAPVASARPGWSALARDDRLAGAIFGATHATFDECIERSLFGLPMQHRPMVEQVARERQHTVLFLFNYSSRMLHGVFGVAGEAGFPLERHAWVAGAWSHDTQSEVRGRWPATRFSAQVRILRFKVSPPPVHMDKLAHVLDVKNGRINKIHQVLSREQTAELLRIFERETDAARARDRY